MMTTFLLAIYINSILIKKNRQENTNLKAFYSEYMQCNAKRVQIVCWFNRTGREFVFQFGSKIFVNKQLSNNSIQLKENIQCSNYRTQLSKKKSLNDKMSLLQVNKKRQGNQGKNSCLMFLRNDKSLTRVIAVTYL